MRSQTILSQPARSPFDPANPRPISAYEAELFARQERARIIGELLAEGIFRAWRLIQRVAAALGGKRVPVRATAN
jgi:hypothetical protein